MKTVAWSLVATVAIWAATARAWAEESKTPAAPAPTAIKTEAPKPSEPAKADAGKPDAAPSEKKIDSVAVTVNGHDIMESDVDARFDEAMMARSGGKPMPAEQRQQQRAADGDRLLKFMIDQYLLDEQIKKAGITLTDAELDKKMDELVQNALKQRGWTREQFNEEIKKNQGMSLDEMIAKTKKEPNFRESALQEKFFQTKHGDELKVTDQDVEAFYKKNLDTYFTEPEMVKASHILIPTMDMETRKAKSPEEKTAALAKAKEVLAEAKKDGADFAALAKKYSADKVSAERGGDLDFFPAQGAMEPAFSAAAFKLKTGEISDIVETPYGYHIIKATDRKASKVTPLDDKVRDKIRNYLQQSKLTEVRTKTLADLKKDAKITYPPGKEPKEAPMPMMMAPTGAAKEAPAQEKPATETPATPAK
jgi:parvulin-like peptidyl-prolyl isomerase